MSKQTFRLHSRARSDRPRVRPLGDSQVSPANQGALRSIHPPHARRRRALTVTNDRKTPEQSISATIPVGDRGESPRTDQLERASPLVYPDSPGDSSRKSQSSCNVAADHLPCRLKRPPLDPGGPTSCPDARTPPAVPRASSSRPHPTVGSQAVAM